MRQKKNSWLYKLGMLLVGMSKHGGDVATHISKTGTKSVSLDKMDAFVQGVEIEENGIHLKQSEINPYCEQYMYRKLVCPSCDAINGCPHCECQFPIKMQAPKTTCDAGEWGAMRKEKEWEAYKVEHGVLFNVTEKN